MQNRGTLSAICAMLWLLSTTIMFHVEACPPETSTGTSQAKVTTCKGQCLNGGTCVNGRCICKTGYTNYDCAKPICSEGLCNNHQYCTAPESCSCLAGWIGATCEIANCTQPCPYGYICTSPPNTCTSVCGQSKVLSAGVCICDTTNHFLASGTSSCICDTSNHYTGTASCSCDSARHWTGSGTSCVCYTTGGYLPNNGNCAAAGYLTKLPSTHAGGCAYAHAPDAGGFCDCATNYQIDPDMGICVAAESRCGSCPSPNTCFYFGACCPPGQMDNGDFGACYAPGQFLSQGCQSNALIVRGIEDPAYALPVYWYFESPEVHSAADLVTLNNIASTLELATGKFFLGLRYSYANKYWYWYSDPSTPVTDPSVQNWATGTAPNPPTNFKYCAYVDTAQSNKWFPTWCNPQIVAPSDLLTDMVGCGHGSNDLLYSALSSSTTATTFAAASTECSNQLSTDLAQIVEGNYPAHYSWAQSLYTALRANRVSGSTVGFWIGVKWSTGNSQWEPSSSPGTAQPVFFWPSRTTVAPNSNTVANDCVIIDNNGNWQNVPCTGGTTAYQILCNIP